MRARKILKIYLVLFNLIFMTSLLGVAQQYKVLRIDKIKKEKIFELNTVSTDAIVYFNLPNFKDTLIFEPNIKRYLLNKKYNSKEKRWELSFSPNKLTGLVVKAPGFKPVELTIDYAAKSITEFQVYEVTSDTPAKLTIKANLPDAKISIWSNPQGKRIVEEKLVEGVYILDKIPAGTVRILIEKEGYSSKEELVTLESGEKKEIELSLDPKIKFVRIESTPSKAKFFFDDNPQQQKETTFSGNIPGGTRKLTFKNEFFKDTVLVLSNESTYNVILQRKISKISFSDDKVDKVFIDGKELQNKNGNFSHQVPLGEKYEIRVLQNDLDDFVRPYVFTRDEEKLVDFKQDWSNHFNRLIAARKRKNKSTVSFVVGLAGIGSGLYLMQSANKNYEAYKNASSSTEAASLRKQVESADQLSPIALGVGGFFTGLGLIFLIK
jgi:hypothetical protein